MRFSKLPPTSVPPRRLGRALTHHNERTGSTFVKCTTTSTAYNLLKRHDRKPKFQNKTARHHNTKPKQRSIVPLLTRGRFQLSLGSMTRTATALTTHQAGRGGREWGRTRWMSSRQVMCAVNRWIRHGRSRRAAARSWVPPATCVPSLSIRRCLFREARTRVIECVTLYLLRFIFYSCRL